MIQIPKGKIACVPLFDPDRTESGLYVPEIAKERCDQGIVKYIGGECDWVKPGDHVLFSGYTGTLVSLSDEGLLIILPEKFVIAIIHSADFRIPGLYFRSHTGDYLTATYEQSMNLIAKGLEESPWYKELSINALKQGKKGWVNVPVPAKEDYDAWHS